MAKVAPGDRQVRGGGAAGVVTAAAVLLAALALIALGKVSGPATVVVGAIVAAGAMLVCWRRLADDAGLGGLRGAADMLKRRFA